MATWKLFCTRFSAGRGIGQLFRKSECAKLSTSSCLLDKSKEPGDGSQSSPKGRICDKKPVKLVLEDGKLYSWCTCGLSKKQPFCDNTHRELNKSNPDKSVIQFKSHKFQVDTKKEYALCNCKQTNKRPFCDGTHKQKYIQEAVLHE